MSASVVCQPLTLMRMAATPCQLVPPIQASPLVLHAPDDVARALVIVAEPDEHLVQAHLVEDARLRDRCERIGHAAGKRAATLDEVAHTVPAERSKRGVQREAARAS